MQLDHDPVPAAGGPVGSPGDAGTPVLDPLLARDVERTADEVVILDRRAFPFRQERLRCHSVDAVAQAIEDGATDGSGAYFAALAGMALAAREAARMAPDPARTHLDLAGRRLSGARRGRERLRAAVHAVLSSVDAATGAAGRPPGGAELLAAAMAGIEAAEDSYRDRSRALGRHTAALLPVGATVLTHGWGDLPFVELVAASRRTGKRLSFLCTETRPDLRGARLTAETLTEMGVEVAVTTDAAGPALLATREAHALVTAADRVAMDGAVVNEVGTLALAVAAYAFGTPYHVMVHTPDRHTPTGAGLALEFRPGEDAVHAAGRRTTSDRIRGMLPEFDITPPQFVGTVVTDRGPFPPGALAGYFADTPPRR